MAGHHVIITTPGSPSRYHNCESILTFEDICPICLTCAGFSPATQPCFGSSVSAWPCSISSPARLRLPPRRAPHLLQCPRPRVGLRRLRTGDRIPRTHRACVLRHLADRLPILRRHCLRTHSRAHRVHGARHRRWPQGDAHRGICGQHWRSGFFAGSFMSYMSFDLLWWVATAWCVCGCSRMAIRVGGLVSALSSASAS